MTKLVLAAVLGVSLFSAAQAGPEYKTYRDRLGFGSSNGTQLSGITLEALVVHAVILASGKSVALP